MFLARPNCLLLNISLTLDVGWKQSIKFKRQSSDRRIRDFWEINSQIIWQRFGSSVLISRRICKFPFYFKKLQPLPSSIGSQQHVKGFLATADSEEKKQDIKLLSHWQWLSDVFQSSFLSSSLSEVRRGNEKRKKKMKILRNWEEILRWLRWIRFTFFSFSVHPFGIHSELSEAQEDFFAKQKKNLKKLSEIHHYEDFDLDLYYPRQSFWAFKFWVKSRTRKHMVRWGVTRASKPFSPFLQSPKHFRC